MDDNKFSELLSKLDITLNADGSNPSVSPSIKTPDGVRPCQGLYITPELDVEQLNQNELILAHALLHQFYATGIKNLSKEQIKDVHDRVAERLNHTEYDDLDY